MATAELDLMLLVAPEFARLAVLPVLAVLLAARCLSPAASPCLLPFWRPVSAAVLLVAPLVVLTASLGLVAWGFMSRYDNDMALNFFWARDIVLQVSWLPFDVGVLYFFNPAVVLALLPSARVSRGVLIAIFVAVLVAAGTGRVLCLVGLVVPGMRSSTQTASCVISALLVATVSAPLALTSHRMGHSLRCNPWVPVSVALIFYVLSTALPIQDSSVATHYALLVFAACMQICALCALLLVFHSPATPQLPLQPAIRLAYSTPERASRRRASTFLGGHHRTSAASQDFMSLRDPFASPPPTIMGLREKKTLQMSPLSSSSISPPPKAKGTGRRDSLDSLGLDAAFLEQLVTLSFSECEQHDEQGSAEGSHCASSGWNADVDASPRSIPSPTMRLVSPGGARARTDSMSTYRAATPTPMPRAYRAGAPSPPSFALSSPAASSRDWTRELETSLDRESDSAE